MTVAQLKAELLEKQLSTTGKKSDLIKRLQGAQTSKHEEKGNKGKEEKKLSDKVLAVVEGLTVAQLKATLVANDQKCSGAKGVLIERVVDGIVFGALPRCPSCSGGRLQVQYATKFGHGGQGRFKCPGSFDDDHYVRCSFRSDDRIERPKWIVNEEVRPELAQLQL